VKGKRPLVEDSHHFDVEQDPDPHQSDKSVIKVKRGIQIRIRIKKSGNATLPFDIRYNHKEKYEIRIRGG
jgi:hypothetical protein